MSTYTHRFNTIYTAAAKGNLVHVNEWLLDDRICSADCTKALRYAAESGHVDIVYRLLEDGRADPSTNDNEALRVAKSYKHTAVIKCLLRDQRVVAHRKALP